jgi:chemotaxis protein CheC
LPCARISRVAFSGRTLLIFPERMSLELVLEVIGREESLEDIVDLEDEALAETGNVILNSWVATLASLLTSGLKMSLPIVIRGDSNAFRSLVLPPRIVLAYQI